MQPKLFKLTLMAFILGQAWCLTMAQPEGFAPASEPEEDLTPGEEAGQAVRETVEGTISDAANLGENVGGRALHGLETEALKGQAIPNQYLMGCV